MFLPTIHPPFPPTSAESGVLEAHPASGAAASGSGVGSKHEPLRSPASEAEWSEERDRELAARAFVNHAADIALHQSLGALCKSCVCGACGITFLSASALDDRCHVCVGER